MESCASSILLKPTHPPSSIPLRRCNWRRDAVQKPRATGRDTEAAPPTEHATLRVCCRRASGLAHTQHCKQILQTLVPEDFLVFLVFLTQLLQRLTTVIHCFYLFSDLNGPYFVCYILFWTPPLTSYVCLGAELANRFLTCMLRDYTLPNQHFPQFRIDCKAYHIAKPKLCGLLQGACQLALQGVKQCQFVQALYCADTTYVPNATKQHAAALCEIALLQFCTVWCSRCIARYRTTLHIAIPYKHSVRSRATGFGHDDVHEEIDRQNVHIGSS